MSLMSLSLSPSHSLVYFSIFLPPLALSRLWVMCVFFVFCWKQFIYAIDMFFAFFSVISFCCFYICLFADILARSHAKFRLLMWLVKWQWEAIIWNICIRQGEKEIKNFLTEHFDFEVKEMGFFEVDCWPSLVGAINLNLFNFKRQVWHLWLKLNEISSWD